MNGPLHALALFQGSLRIPLQIMIAFCKKNQRYKHGKWLSYSLRYVLLKLIVTLIVLHLWSPHMKIIAPNRENRENNTLLCLVNDFIEQFDFMDQPWTWYKVLKFGCCLCLFIWYRIVSLTVQSICWQVQSIIQIFCRALHHQSFWIRNINQEMISRIRVKN